MKFRILFMLMMLALLLVSITPLTAQDTTECENGFRLIVHALGETCVSNDVQRVVTLEHSMTEAVATLGVQPIGVADLQRYNVLVGLPIPPSEDTVDVGSRNEPNLEIITSLNPDLIIAASWRVTENYDELNAIAPTITFVGSEDLATMSDYFTTIAIALNREAEAQQILEDMHQHFTDAATRVSDANVDSSFILSQTWYEDSIATFRLFTDNSMPVEILTQIGLENDWSGESNPDGFSVVGIEALGELEPTNFLFITDVDSAPFYAESPLWNSLPFVQAGTAYRLNDDLWLFGGPLSAQRFVNAVLEALGVDEVVMSGIDVEE
jgi:ferric hydroxamate transport system substrate-binding protein